MNITDFIHKETIIPDLGSADKKSVLIEMAQSIADFKDVSKDEVVKVLLEREQLGSTGIGHGIGIPHGKMRDLDEIVIGFALSRNGVDFDSLDRMPAHIFFLILTPENSTGLHLRLLAKISKMLRNDDFRQKLQQSSSIDDIYEIISTEDEAF